MAVDAARAKSLFLEASELADPAERAAYLERECGGDAELRHGSRRCWPPTTGPADPWRATPPGRPNRPHPKPRKRPRRPTRKRVRRRNWRPRKTDRTARTSRSPAPRRPTAPADPSRARSSPAGTRCSRSSARGAWAPSTGPSQTEPVKRQVALKLIKIGMDSRAVLARFDAERQALALMDHPNIARVYDGGTTEAGQPFFVMELVERRADHRVLRPAAAPGPGPAGAVRRGLPGGAARPPEGDHPPRPQARQRAGHRGGRPADAEGHRLRRRQGDRVQAHRPEPGRHRGDRRHADVHVARAGRPVVDGHRHPDRRLCAGRDPLRAAGRLAADRREAVQAGGDPGDAADGAGGRPAQAEHQGEHGRGPAEHRGQPRHRAGAA